jgi:V8-like Glu-specific endopeptidase
MPQPSKIIRPPRAGKLFLCVLAIVYAGYLVVFVNFLHPSISTPSIVDHPESTTSSIVTTHWTTATMRNAVDADVQDNAASTLTQATVDTSKGKAAQQTGQQPRDSSLPYPLSTVGKVFFSNDYGQDYVCSGTAIASSNHNTVDTAGHCLYWQGGWMQNLIFCPLYDSGNTPYGCWVGRDLEVPADWIGAGTNELHHDFGMVIVSPNSEGNLTDIVGGAGWAYNQPTDQAYYAYGYPAGYPYDGQTIQACDDGSIGKSWQFAGGTVVSIPCPMTGGSSGGPWFIKSNGTWYLSGHNDFTSSMQPGHMFSPYYDDTWYALYSKAQSA